MRRLQGWVDTRDMIAVAGLLMVWIGLYFVHPAFGVVVPGAALLGGALLRKKTR